MSCMICIAEKIKVVRAIVSDYQRQVIEYNNFFLGKNEKLILNLSN